MKNSILWCGRALTFVCVAYILRKLWINPGSIWGLNWSVWRVITLLLSLAIYMLAGLIFGAAWTFILKGMRLKVPLGEAVEIVMLSNIAKYLPGNFLQYVGRAYLAKQKGFPLKVVSLSLGIEAIMAVLVSSCLSLLLLGPTTLKSTLSNVGISASSLAWFIAVLMLVALVLARSLILRILGKILRLRLSSSLSLCKCWMGSICLFLCIFGLHGLANGILYQGLVDGPFPGFSMLTGAFSLAWVCGLLTPGSPGGLGVREAVFTMLLGVFYNSTTILGLAIVWRGVSVLGDVLLWLLAKPLGKMVLRLEIAFEEKF